MPGEIPYFGFYHDEPILPPSEQRESMTVKELQEKYPLRYKLYCQEGENTEPVDSVSPEIIVRRLQMLNNLDRYITTHERPGRDRVLREKQLAVFRDTREFLETGETEGYVEAPTGFGKTVLFSEVIRATNQRTLVVVPSRILVEQTYNRLRQFNPTLDIGRYYSDKKERDKQVTVTTYQSLIISCGGVRPEDIDLLILDEVHQSLTDVRIQAIGRFASPVKLGFTATPEYTQDKRVENLLNNEIHTVTLKEAVETGLLCSFSVYFAQTDVDLSSVKIDEDGDYNERELEEAINIYSRNKSAVELYKKLNSERLGLSKAIAYCVSIKHAKDVARIFNEAGIPAKAVWSNQDPYERRKILEDYNRCDIKILTNVNVLTEGFDDPQAALCLNLRPTLSKVVAKQRGGRVLRLDPDNPGKHAIVVDYLDRNENKRTLQVTFAQVAEGAQIINPFTVRGNGGNRGGNGGVLVDGKDQFDLDNLQVITNAQEVLRIVNELKVSDSRDQELEVQENDFPLTQSNIVATFRGKYYRIRKIIDEVVAQLQESEPNLIQCRITSNNPISVVANKQMFLDLMQQRGVEIKETELEELKDTDFPLTLGPLRDFFSGSSSEIKNAAQKIMRQFKEADSNLVARRKTKAGVISVVINKNLFIKAMLHAGYKPIEKKTSEFEEVKATDFPITVPGLREVFSGREAGLKPLVGDIIATLEKTNPELIQERKHGKNVVKVVTNRNLFIQKMVQNGAILKNDGNAVVKETDFVALGARHLTAIFVGSTKTLRPKAIEVMEYLAAQDSSLVTIKRSGSQTVHIVTDRNRFILEMIKRGVKLKMQN